MEQNKETTKKAVSLSKPNNLAGLIDYQKSAVVSRTLIKKKSGTVTIFSFDKGEGLSEHIAPFDAMVLILDGIAEINIEGKPNRVECGESILLPEGKTHSLKAIERFKMLLIMVKSSD